MKKLTLILPFILLLLTACHNHKTEQTDGNADTINVVYAIQQQSRLYTAQYDVHKIVTRDDVKRMEGSLFGHKFSQQLSIGNRKIAIPIDVTLQAYVDLTYINEQNIIRKGDKIHILLPDPRVVVTSSKVDNAGIRQQVGMLRSNFSDSDLTDYTRQGVASVIASVPQMGIIETARENAASTLIPLLVRMGFDEENITITFRKDFNTADVSSLFDSEGSVVKF